MTPGSKPARSCPGAWRILVLGALVLAGRAMEIPDGLAGIIGTPADEGGTAVAIAPHRLITLFEALPEPVTVGQNITLVVPPGRRVTATVAKLGTSGVLLDCPANLQPFAIGPAPAIGQTVWTVGNSIGALVLDGQAMRSRGTVSGRDAAAQDETRGRGGLVVSRYRGPVLEITAAINEGSQGGAVVDDQGRLLGLATNAGTKARRQGAAVPWAVLAADLGLEPPPAGPTDPSDPAWLVAIAWRRPGGLGNPTAIPRPLRAVDTAPPAERGQLNQWWNAWFHQRQVFRTDHPCPALVLDPGKGLLLTAASNLAGGATVGSLMLPTGRKPVEVVATDLALDLALVRCPEALDLPAAPWALAVPSLASPVQVMGRHRQDGPATRTAGIVSALGRHLSQSQEGFFQVDARADYGSLGGAILGPEGTLVGMVVLIGPEAPWLVASGVTLGVDGPTIQAALKPLTAGTSRQRPQTLGLGVSLDDRNGQLLIRAVVPGTGAEAAGIKPGDLLMAVDGHTVSSHPAVARHLLKHRAGDRVPLTIERGVRRLVVTVELRIFGGGP